LDLEHAKVEANYRIKLPNDSIVNCPILCKHLLIFIGEYIFPRNLIQFDMSEFDVILGMNWLYIYEPKIDCKDLKVILSDEKGREVSFYGQREGKRYSIISTMKTSNLLCQSFARNWCYAINIQKKEEKAEDIPIVREFKYVFPKELSGLLPQREIDFEIELILGPQHVSKAPHGMAHTELKELKIQLEELL